MEVEEDLLNYVVTMWSFISKHRGTRCMFSYFVHVTHWSAQCILPPTEACSFIHKSFIVLSPKSFTAFPFHNIQITALVIPILRASLDLLRSSNLLIVKETPWWWKTSCTQCGISKRVKLGVNLSGASAETDINLKLYAWWTDGLCFMCISEWNEFSAGYRRGDSRHITD